MLGSTARYLIRGRGMRHYLVTLACASSAALPRASHRRDELARLSHGLDSQRDRCPQARVSKNKERGRCTSLPRSLYSCPSASSLPSIGYGADPRSLRQGISVEEPLSTCPSASTPCRYRYLRLPDAGRPEQDQVLGPLDEGQGGELAHQLAVDGGLEGEVELLEGFHPG